MLSRAPVIFSYGLLPFSLPMVFIHDHHVL
jgi:hypothetical protein